MTSAFVLNWEIPLQRYREQIQVADRIRSYMTHRNNSITESIGIPPPAVYAYFWYAFDETRYVSVSSKLKCIVWLDLLLSLFGPPLTMSESKVLGF